MKISNFNQIYFSKFWLFYFFILSHTPHWSISLTIRHRGSNSDSQFIKMRLEWSEKYLSINNQHIHLRMRYLIWFWSLWFFTVSDTPTATLIIFRVTLLKTPSSASASIFTRGQFLPSGIVVACVCVYVCVSVCPHDNSSTVQARIAKLGPEM